MHAAFQDPSLRLLADAYGVAREAVIEAGYWSEIQWAGSRCIETLSSRDVMSEAAWVILNSGMREKVIRDKFPGITRAFLDWSDPTAIADALSECVTAAMAVFRHRPKLEAIGEVVKYLSVHGLDAFKANVIEAGPPFLERFPYLGPATSRHLAKNLGVCTSKPDRHLLRIAAKCGSDVETLCLQLSRTVGESVPAVDLVLWRFATINSNYVDYFSQLPNRGV